MENKLIAKWESRTGKHWVCLFRTEDSAYILRSPKSSGINYFPNDEEAIKAAETKLYYLFPDKMKTKPKRVL